MSILKSAEKSELMKQHEPEDYECEMSIAKVWEVIVHRLTEQIESINSEFIIVQVKEKFGGLRYYMQFGEDATRPEKECVYLLIEKAEHEASVTCECCGTQRQVERKSLSWGWVVTLCSECRPALEKEREDER